MNLKKHSPIIIACNCQCGLIEFADNPSTIVAKDLFYRTEILMAPLLETEELKELLLELDELLETDDEELEMPELERL